MLDSRINCAPPDFDAARDLPEGLLAIGGMTALYPNRSDAALNERALKILAIDKNNEANSLLDGAWTGRSGGSRLSGAHRCCRRGRARR